MNQEIFDYLMNFWDHSLGSTVKTIDGSVFSIFAIDPDDNSQVMLHQDCHISNYWHFIQDLIWFPNLQEAIDAVCNKLNITVYSDSIQYQKIIKPIPQSFEELYESITDIRTAILSYPMI